MYLLTQIWLFLAAAFLAGAALGFGAWTWCHRRLGARQALTTPQAGAEPPDVATWRQRAELAELKLTEALRARMAEVEPIEQQAAQRLAHERDMNASEDRRRRDAEAAALSAASARVRSLENELADLKRQIAAASPVDGPASPASIPARVSRKAADGPRRLKRPRRGKGDDLKLIWGVGADLASRLNALGFFHFDQIAKWTVGDVRWVEQQLGDTTERIGREKWVEQCQKLATGWRPQNEAGERPG